MGEVMCIADLHGAVNCGKSGSTAEFTRLRGKLRGITCGDIRPVAGGIGHETQFVRAATVVESINLDGAVFHIKRGGELDVDEGVAGGRTG